MELNDTLKKYGVDFWQSEVCIMGNDEEIGGGNGYDRTMKTALYVARMIHHDLVYANARSWQWWRAIGGDYKDGLLFQYNDGTQALDTVVDSKLLWALGNYSRFVRPGAVRIEVAATNENGKIIPDSATDPRGLMLSAYRNSDNSVVLVAINYSDEEKTAGLKISGGAHPFRKTYTTSDRDEKGLICSVIPIGEEMIMRIPARSIVTFTE